MGLFMTSSFVKFNIKGGILSPGTLKELIGVAKKLRVKSLYFGERQNIYLRSYLQPSELRKCIPLFESFDYEINKDVYPNIISSYVSEEVFTSSNNWLGEGNYKDVLDSFEYKPKLKINIVDNTQGLVPLFTGNLNFISSDQPNFWYLYVKHPSLEGIQSWPDLIYTGDIATVAKALEAELSVNNTLKADLMHLSKLLANSLVVNTIPLKVELVLPRLRFPNYEGMNKHGEGYWLGIYRRSYDFPIEFLDKVADLCKECKIGALYLTPFKSLIIKGIKEEDRFKWEKILGQYGINIRHNISELNWKVRDLDDEGASLKKYLARELDGEDVRTFGLTFAVKTGEMDAAASVVIEKNYEINLFNKIKLLPNYSIYYVPDFNPNRQEYKVFSSKRTKFILVDDLILLCRKYYEKLTIEDAGAQVEKKEIEKESPREKKMYQCQECLTIYDEGYGDLSNNVPAGTKFSDLSSTWCCPVCEAPKDSFLLKKLDRTRVLV